MYLLKSASFKNKSLADIKKCILEPLIKNCQDNEIDFCESGFAQYEIIPLSKKQLKEAE
ncbi:hypothetical protein GM661_05570 [Iocasia frigidifontis]|uniref:Uncharacterized protein n=1 Tax=Iocasia fonsfrigidae TaxID=2682810 RepID=A0A8A7KDI6_9FIRM|nr:hypothetical protein [Iocasia fonsfrigidae]QTL97489.1 hypothetical protein GM661_05570 [Iocasia fonsfrigidae]